MAEKRRRSTRRASEEGRPGGTGERVPGRRGLPARPDGQKDAEDDENHGERQGQEDRGQDQKWNGRPVDHALSSFAPILDASCAPVNKIGSNLSFTQKLAKGRFDPIFNPTILLETDEKWA
jgi:hypothetical protein